MGENEARDQRVASSKTIGAADSGTAEELKRLVSGGTMFGSLAGRKRRALWAILSLLFFLGFALSTSMVHAERNGALDRVAKQARDEAQLVAATLTGKQFTKPITGSSYDKLAAKIRKSVSSRGSIDGVTVWSSHGRILFALNESQVETTLPEMQSLIVSISQGLPLGTRVLDNTVQTFMRASKATGGPVAVVEVDQPIAAVDAQVGSVWSIVRLGSVLGLAISLLFLGLTFVSSSLISSSLARAPEQDEWPELEDWLKGDEGAEMKAEAHPAEPTPEEPTPSEEPAPSSDEDRWALQPDLDQAISQDNAPEDDDESQDVMRQRREEFKARAEQAELRIKNQEAELHEAPSAQTSGR